MMSRRRVCVCPQSSLQTLSVDSLRCSPAPCASITPIACLLGLLLAHLLPYLLGWLVTHLLTHLLTYLLTHLKDIYMYDCCFVPWLTKKNTSLTRSHTGTSIKKGDIWIFNIRDLVANATSKPNLGATLLC
eukprot:GHVU01160073.1.p1 GENE.GHVU01160073.1~~GHVU01160073.1.p1  ORF type:complete len:131 (+),score=0.03 GHVU01160073.1:163-555(+)